MATEALNLIAGTSGVPFQLARAQSSPGTKPRPYALTHMFSGLALL